jgi:hypothetical protein
MPEETNVQEERFIFSQKFHSSLLAPLLLGHGNTKHHGSERVEEQSCSPLGGQEAGEGGERVAEGPGTRLSFQNSPSDPLPQEAHLCCVHPS